MERAPRYSNWKITKRPFKRVGTSDKSTEKQNDTDTTKTKKGHDKNPLSSSPRKKIRTGINSTSNPLTSPKVQNENQEVDESVNGDNIQTEMEHTPDKIPRLNDVEETPPPGDVSVTFLASTPKPGRPQLSRRRPLSSVRENSDVAAILESSNKSSNVPSKSSERPRRIKSSIPKTQYENSLQKQDKSAAGRSIEDKMSKIAQSVVERKRLSARKASDVSGPRSVSKSVSASNETELTGSRSMSERSMTRSNSCHNVNTSEASDDDDQVQTKRKTAVNRSVKITKSVNKSKATSVKTKTVKKTGKQGNSSDSPDDTRVQTKSVTKRKVSVSCNVQASLEVASNTDAIRKKGYLGDQREVTRRDKTGRKGSSTANIPTDQTVMLWQTDDQKRYRRDVMDLDLVLNCITETLESDMDVYELHDGQAAARLLKKYLATDVTHMIQAAQTVANVQTRIKQSGQSIKQKQKKLMSLQKEKMELEEKCLPAKDLQEKNEKMMVINDFLSNLQTLVNQC